MLTESSKKYIVFKKLLSFVVLVSRYVRVYDLPGPCDDIEVVLGQMATRLGAQRKGEMAR